MIPTEARAYRYPDAQDVIPAASMRVRYVYRRGLSWDEADAQLVGDALSCLDVLTPIRVADVGGGGGRLAAVAAASAGEVVLVEPDEGRAAKARRALASHSTCTVVEEDLATFATSGDLFHLVLCSHVLQHVPVGARVEFLAALATITAPDGIALLTFPANPSGGERLLVTTRPLMGTPSQTFAVDLQHFETTMAEGGALAVWHASRDQVFQLLRAGGLEAVVAVPYRAFEFAMTVPNDATPKWVAANDVAVVAKPVGGRAR